MSAAPWRRLTASAALLVAIVGMALMAAVTPAERAEAQSVPNLFWSITAFGVSEASTSSNLEIQTSQPLTNALTFSYTIGGTATPGVDYTIDAGSPDYAARTGTFAIPAGTPRFTTVAIPITALEDTVSDSGETIILTITDGANYNLGSGVTATATIYENTGKSAFRTGGRAQVGGILTVQRVCTDPDGESSIAYQWQRASDPRTATGRFRNISGATSSSYTLQQADSGHFIRMNVRYTDSNGLHTVVYTPTVGPIGPVGFDNTVKFSRNSYNAREGDPLRPTLTFSSPTKRARTFEIFFQTCDAHMGEDVVTDDPSGNPFETGFRSAAHSVTVPAGVTSHTFSLPVLFDDRIEGYETFVMGFGIVPRGITIGDQSDATNQGQYAQVQIVDVNFVPENWALKPSGVSTGDQFRLLFKTENERNAESGNIGDYDTFIRNRIGGTSTGHADIRQYRDTFRVVGSTGAVAAAWHTATGIMVSGEPGHTPFSHPIYWMGGPKVADDYNDFWDGTWDANRQTGPHQRNALGVVTTNKRGANTGTKSGTTHATAGAKATYHLGHGTHTRWGGTMQNHNPINQGQIPVGDSNVYLGLSGIFLPLDVSPANPLVTIETRRARVEEGTAITYTLRAIPAPSSPVIVNLKVSETTDGGPNFINSGDQGPRMLAIPTSGVKTFTVDTLDDELGEPDGGVTVSIVSGTGYRTLAASDTVMTVITSSDISLDISVGAALGDGSNGPAQTGANVDFTFSLPKALEGRNLSGIRTQLAWGGDVLSPRSDQRPTTWDRYAYTNRKGGSGAYVRPWLESSIMPGDRSFSLRVHVKNRAEAGGDVGNGWIAMRVAPDPNPDDKSNNYIAHPDAEWACMPVGGGTCPSAWPDVPTASIVPLDNGTVMSGNEARYRITVNPAPGTGETRRVYLKTWEVFVKPTDPKVLIVGGVRIKADGSPFNAVEEAKLTGLVEIDAKGNPTDEDVVVEIQTQRGIQYKYYYNQPRRGGTQVQFTGYTHVDVDSGGSAEFTLPTKIYRSTENMAGRNYWAEVQEDIAYSVGDGSSAEVVTTVFDTAQVACWYGHSHQRARLITVDGAQVYSPEGMGITECLAQNEIDEWKYGNGSTSNRPTVWTSCKPDYGHREHPYLDGNGNIHHHHNHNPYIKLGDGSCPGGQPQTDGHDSQDGEADQQGDPFPAPGAMGFSDVTDSSMTLSWSQREVDHYLVYWAENAAGAETQSAQVDAGTLTYTISGLKADTDYAVIVYSQDYDEVTPTSYQRTAAASCTPNLPSDALTVSEVKSWRSDYSHAAHVSRWNRVLAALGEDTGEAAMSADDARAIKQIYNNNRWDRTVRTLDAIEECPASSDTTVPVVPPPPPPPPATPEVSISGGAGITEGGVATFTISANPSPAADVDVTVSVTQSGDYGVTVGQRTVTISTSGSTTLTVATTNDSTDESNGSVTVGVNSGTGYTVSSTAGSASVAVSDDDDPPPPTPEVSIAAGSGVNEGSSATFTLTASPAPTSPLAVTVSVTQSGDYGVATGSQTVTIPTSGSVTLTIATSDDSTDESNGSVTVTVSSGTDYDVSSSNGSATVAISDDDDPPAPVPVVNSTPTLSISDASATEGDTITFTVTLSPSSSRYVWVNYYARPAYGTAASATYADFEMAYGMLTFKPGETEKTITVTSVEDQQSEGNETFVVGLYSEVQAKVADRVGTGTIIDND